MLLSSGSVDAIKAAVRPTVTWGLIVVQAGLSVDWATDANTEQAFTPLALFTMMAMTFWFRSREDASNA
jgi:hypothetical protein